MIKLKSSYQDLTRYNTDQNEYLIKLNANEMPYPLLTSLDISSIVSNRYPDSDAIILREKMAAFYGCEQDQIIVGNGSSELIDFIFRCFVERGDNVLSFTPSFSMYQKYADLAEVNYLTIPINDDCTQDVQSFIEKAKKNKVKLGVICTPNNPTGYKTSSEDIIKVLKQLSNTLIIVDEAYLEFSGDSVIDLVGKYNNLIVMRTLSKAFALPSIRVGALITNKDLIEEMLKVKMPYNLNSLSQEIAITAFNNLSKLEENISLINESKKRLIDELRSLSITCFESDANFIYVKSEINLYELLRDEGILIRAIKENEFRITVGKECENKALIKALRRIINEKGN